MVEGRQETREEEIARVRSYLASQSWKEKSYNHDVNKR